MKEFSKEIIEINGKEYTLFINRTGIVAWEKFCKKERELAETIDKKYESLTGNDEVEITKDTNPFEGLEEYDEDENIISKMFRKLYWIMLYTEHKFSIDEVNELYNQAIDEYGEEQLIMLGKQMIEDANTNLINKTQNLKNLKALRPTK